MLLPEISIPGAPDLTWRGLSRAGESTCFVIPQLRWMFDCGPTASATAHWRPACIFLTHTHADHVQGLAHVLMSSTKDPRTRVYLPAAALPAVERHLSAFYDLIRDDDETDTNLQQVFNFDLCPVEFGQEFMLPKQKKGGGNYQFQIRPIECDHRKVCVGYSIYRRQPTLKPEYKGLTGLELGKLVKQKVELKEMSNFEPFLCFLGDTTPTVFDRHPEILQDHAAIAVECTFYQETDVKLAATTRHMRFPDLPLARNPDVLFMLQHFSRRHGDKKWRTWIREYNNESSSCNSSTRRNNAHIMLPELDNDDNESFSCNCFACCARNTDSG